MGSSNQKPEEAIRKAWIEKMAGDLSFPASTLAREVDLRKLPHLAHLPGPFPHRRADIICFAKGIHPRYELYPLLLVECKAVPLNEKALSQVTGYNYHLQAYFVACVNAHEALTGWYDKEQRKYCFRPGLPSFPELMRSFQPIGVRCKSMDG
jgi:hypothetical protein